MESQSQLKTDNDTNIGTTEVDESSTNQYKTKKPKIKKLKKKKNCKRKTGDWGRKGWSEEELAILFKTILQHGHLNLKAIQEALPNKTESDYIDFMRIQKNVAKSFFDKSLPYVESLTALLNGSEATCRQNNIPKSSESIDIAVVMQLLSVDGLIENHPLPENANGVDFPSLYRLIYQALLGYPLQSVNTESLNLLKQVVTEIRNLGDNVECKMLKNIEKHMESLTEDDPGFLSVKKSEAVVKTYGSKGKQVKENATKPSCTIPINVSSAEPNSVLPESFTEEQLNVLQSPGFNPFQFSVPFMFRSKNNDIMEN